MVVVSIRDNIARRFGAVQIAGNDALASRDFVNAIRFSVGSRDTLLGTNPEDFALWHLAEFDEMEGVFTDQEQYVLISGRAVMDAIQEGDEIDYQV